jgi:hypothetical protein
MSAIEKTIVNSKGKWNVEEWTQTKARGGSKIVEKSRSRRGVEESKERNVEYLVVGCKVVIALIIIFRMCKREGI